MKDLDNKEELEALKSDNFSVLMIWAEGCHVCAEAKPVFEQLENKFEGFNFFKTKLSDDTYGFYKKYEQETDVKIPSKDEDGEPILNARGEPITFNTKGYLTLVPKYYVFHGEEASEEDAYGLLGKIDGHNIGQLESILGQIKSLGNEDEATHG